MAGLPIAREFELGRFLAYRVYQEALQPATGRKILGHNIHGDILGHKIHRDMHASQLCGGRQQRSRVLAVARYGLAPCLRQRQTFILGLMKRYRRCAQHCRCHQRGSNHAYLFHHILLLDLPNKKAPPTSMLGIGTLNALSRRCRGGKTGTKQPHLRLDGGLLG